MKRKISLLITTNLLISLVAFSQTDTTYWKRGGRTSLAFSQTSLSNWAAGGENTIGFNSFLSLFYNYKKDNASWDNSLDLAYGLMRQGDEKTKKADDKIDFLSKYGYNVLDKKLYASATIGVRTQFDKGYKYPNDSTVISNFMAPCYVLAGIGGDYKPYDYLSVSVLPISARFTFVNYKPLSDKGSFGVDPGKTLRTEFGGIFRVIFEKDVFTNINLKSKLELFSNYLEKPQNIDVNFEAMLVMKVNKFISTHIGAQMIYDDDIKIKDKNGKVGPRTQFKQIFGVGLTYSF